LERGDIRGPGLQDKQTGLAGVKVTVTPGEIYLPGFLGIGCFHFVGEVLAKHPYIPRRLFGGKSAGTNKRIGHGKFPFLVKIDGLT
jgi:hypothetical protein